VLEQRSFPNGSALKTLEWTKTDCSKWDAFRLSDVSSLLSVSGQAGAPREILRVALLDSPSQLIGYECVILPQKQISGAGVLALGEAHQTPVSQDCRWWSRLESCRACHLNSFMGFSQWRGRTGRGSLPCSTPLQSRERTSSWSPHTRRPPPGPGVGSSNRR